MSYFNSKGTTFILAVLSSEPKSNGQSDGTRGADSDNLQDEMPVERLLEAELAIEPTSSQYIEANINTGRSYLTSHCLGLDAGEQVHGLELIVI